MTSKNCQHIVLDAGHISVESDLADQKAVDAVKAKEHQEYEEEDYKRLESLMYDKFHVKLEDAQVGIAREHAGRCASRLLGATYSCSWDRVSKCV